MLAQIASLTFFGAGCNVSGAEAEWAYRVTKCLFSQDFLSFITESPKSQECPQSRQTRRVVSPEQAPSPGQGYPSLLRCQTEPCEGCEHQGQVHRVGERWRGGPCSACQCLHNLTARCSPYCPLGSCPQVRALECVVGRAGGVWRLVEWVGDRQAA